jgi:glycosyltransferase involved in cell wall biosynthesis
VLVGDAGPEAFRRRGHPPPPNVRFAGRVPDPELRGLLEGALAFLCPSRTEGFGLPPLEAMALGTPAIVAPEGALPEVCAEAALYAPADDPAAWAATLRRLADDPGLRDDYGGRGRTRAERYTWRAAALGLLAAIAEAAESRPGSRP